MVDPDNSIIKHLHCNYHQTLRLGIPRLDKINTIDFKDVVKLTVLLFGLKGEGWWTEKNCMTQEHDNMR